MTQTVLTREQQAVEVHLRAVLHNLEEFHGLKFDQASQLVDRIKDSEPNWLLHTEPYVIAFDLVKGGEPMPEGAYARDRRRSEEIYERALRELGAEKIEAPPKTLEERVEQLQERVRRLERGKIHPAKPASKPIKVGVYHGQITEGMKRKVQELLQRGKTAAEVAKATGLSPSRVTAIQQSLPTRQVLRQAR